MRGPLARIGARVSPPPRRDDPIAALNQVLSEVIDAILDVKQAYRRVPPTHALNAVLDRLPGLRLDPDADDPHIHGLIFRSPPNLPVRFDPA